MNTLKEYDERLERGLTSISIGDYKLFRPNEYSRLGCLRVVDNETRLRGLISANGEEVLPCIFDDVDVKLDGFIEVHFKGRYYEFILMADGFVPKRDEANLFICKNGFYVLEMNNNLVDAEGGEKFPDETTQQLITLLKVKHSIQQD